MLGEQIEVKGKTIGQRVLDVQAPKIETSVSVSGSIKGTQMKETFNVCKSAFMIINKRI